MYNSFAKYHPYLLIYTFDEAQHPHQFKAHPTFYGSRHSTQPLIRHDTLGLIYPPVNTAILRTTHPAIGYNTAELDTTLCGIGKTLCGNSHNTV